MHSQHFSPLGFLKKIMKRRLLLSKVPMAGIAIAVISYRLTSNRQEVTFEKEAHTEDCNCKICLQKLNYPKKQT
jgi:hypothetical protein